MANRPLQVLIVFAGLLCSIAAVAQQTQMGAWRYEVGDAGKGAPAFRAVATGAANKTALIGFACDSPGPVSIYAFIVPGSALGVPKNGALKKGVTYQVDGGAAITKDWFYPDETKNETEISKTIGVDSFDVLNAVRKGKKTVRVQALKTDGKNLELSFEIGGADAALAKLVADCKSAEYK